MIKPEVDKKGDTNIVSRLGIERKVDIILKREDTIIDKLDMEKLHSIVVDEAQFLTPKQVEELWLISKLYDIPVMAYGLKTTFQGDLFLGSKPLLEKADEIDELVTICKCGKKAKFNARIINGNYTLAGDEIAIDGIDATYDALCPECYIDKVLNITKDDFVKRKYKKI